MTSSNRSAAKKKSFMNVSLRTEIQQKMFLLELILIFVLQLKGRIKLVFYVRKNEEGIRWMMQNTDLMASNAPNSVLYACETQMGWACSPLAEALCSACIWRHEICILHHPAVFPFIFHIGVLPFCNPETESYRNFHEDCKKQTRH